MLENLTKSFSTLFSKLSSQKKLTSENIEESIRTIRLALIEADVALPVIKVFLDEIRTAALGKTVAEGVTPSDVFIKTVHDALIQLLGGDACGDINLKAPTTATHVLVCGLQGSGKTTTLGKLALRYKSKRDVLLVSLDTSRPAAALQLEKLAKEAGVAYFARGNETNLKKIVKQAKSYAKKHSHNLIFYDTAGRTQVNTEMLDELKMVYKACEVSESIFVLDAMLGQRALKIAEAFKATLPLDSLLFTKFDSDTSGGAILSVKYTIDVPIRFVGVGEKIENLELFDPKRVAERILGMGDIVGLVEKAEKVMDEKDSEALAKKLSKNEFDLEDMLTQIKQMNKMGPLQSLVGMLPGVGSQLSQTNVSEIQEQAMKEMRVVIESMTRKERSKPFLLNNSRKIRIAKGSGTNIVKVNQMLKKFSQMKAMMKKMQNPSKMKKMLASLGQNAPGMQASNASLANLTNMQGNSPNPNDPMSALFEKLNSNR